MSRQLAEGLSVTKNVDGLLVTYEGGQIVSPDELLDRAEVDLERWEVFDSGIKQWPTTFKLESKVAGTKLVGEDRAVQVQNVMVWVKLKPRQDFIDSLDIAERMSEIMEKHSPKYRPVHRPVEDGDGKVLALLDLFDLHMGMLAQGAETGEANWDSKLLQEEVMTAVEWLLQTGAAFDIGRFLFIVGNDLLHADNPENKTSSGRHRQDVDSRPFKMYEMAYLLMVWVIDRLREIADVDVEIVPGNHDRDNSQKIGLTLKAHYRQDDHVHVNATPQLRATYVWGSNFIGMTHGSEEKLSELPMIFMAENPRAWGEATHRHILTGHLHRRARKKIPAIETGMHMSDTLGTFNGVTVEVIPSLVPPEAWHASKGYVGGGRSAEIRFYHKDRGPMGYFEYRVDVER